MGPIEISPVCDIATSVGRTQGTVSVDTHFENRLGVSVGILYRNGVNVYIPPMRKGSIATGHFDIYLHYRCSGNSLLNQFAGFLEKHPKFAKVDEPNGLNDTSLKLVYRIAKADLDGTDVFYVDELDLTIVLNPTHGMPSHARESVADQELRRFRETIEHYPAFVQIGVPYEATHVNVILGGVKVKFPAYENKSGPVAEVSFRADGEFASETYRLDPRFVFPDNELASAEADSVEQAIAESKDGSVGFSNNFFDRLGVVEIDNNRRDVGKELTTLNDAVEKVRTNQRAEELARLKHAQATAGEGLKVITSASNLGAKILEVLP